MHWLYCYMNILPPRWGVIQAAQEKLLLQLACLSVLKIHSRPRRGWPTDGPPRSLKSRMSCLFCSLEKARRKWSYIAGADKESVCLRFHLRCNQYKIDGPLSVTINALHNLAVHRNVTPFCLKWFYVLFHSSPATHSFSPSYQCLQSKQPRKGSEGMEKNGKMLF